MITTLAERIRSSVPPDQDFEAFIADPSRKVMIDQETGQQWDIETEDGEHYSHATSYQGHGGQTVFLMDDSDAAPAGGAK